MITPWGELEILQLNDADTQKTVLFYEKAQLLEGLVVEQVLDQILSSTAAVEGIRPVPVELVIAKSRGTSKGSAFVWIHQQTAEVVPLLDCLCQRYATWPIIFDASKREFLTSATPHERGRPIAFTIKLQDQMRLYTGRAPAFTAISASVRDASRQEQAFWGFLVGAYGDRLTECVLLPRILKNFGIQAFFDWVWDVDRLFLTVGSGTFWAMEIKHKFPIPSDCSFGLNTGEFRLLQDLSGIGIRCLHVVAVKPYWDKDRSSQYLFNDMAAREHVLLLACEIDRNIAEAMQRGGSATSGGHTTFTGSGTLTFYRLPADRFHKVGLLASTVERNAAGFASMLLGQSAPFTSPAEIRGHRMGNR